MAKGNGLYDWSQTGTPPKIALHSRAKHDVLKEYIKQYVRVFSANPRMPKLTLHLVDGFSGGGIYLDKLTNQECYGSPLVILDAVREVEAEINAERRNPFQVAANCYFIDADQNATSCLSDTLKKNGYASQIDQNLHCITGMFAEKVDDVLKVIGNTGRQNAGRAIFFLDQYGYKDVPFPTLKKILTTLPHAEIILTFAVDKLFDFFNEGDQFQGILAQLGVTEDAFQKLCEHLGQDQNTARHYLQSDMARIIQTDSGAKFITRFFITSRESNRAYWLIHLSNHEKAHAEMLKIHWEMKNTFTNYGQWGLDAFPTLLGYDPDKDPNLNGKKDQTSLFSFGDDAKELSLTALRRDLPKLIKDAGKPVTYLQLREACAVNTPASAELFKTAIMHAVQDSELTLKTDKGSARRSALQITGSDIIEPASQRSFFHMMDMSRKKIIAPTAKIINSLKGAVDRL